MTLWLSFLGRARSFFVIQWMTLRSTDGASIGREGARGPRLLGRLAYDLSNLMKPLLIAGLEIVGPMNPRYGEILSPAACRFLAELFAKFGPTREQLLARRVTRQREIDAGRLPDFLPETAAIRSG